MTRGDRILVLVLALFALVAIPAVSIAVGVSGDGIVVDGPYGRTTLDPSEDVSVVIEGLQGDVVVVVEGGTVRVVESSCPDQICVNAAPIGAEGGVIACVPNGVTVTVDRRAEGGLDAVVR